MISVLPATSGPTTELLSHRGGFLWWYAELVDGDGNGAVLIWSWALPFLPGLAHSARQQQPECVGDRPSLNLAIYRAGRLDAYWLEEYAPEECHWDGGTHWQFGRSRLSLTGSESLTLDAHLDLDLTAGSPLRGSLQLVGVAAAPPRYGDDPRHAWTPLMGPAHGRLDLTCGERTWSQRSPAYFDRNHGTAMLHELGIGTWLWAHGVSDDEQRIAYVLLPGDGGPPEAFGVSISSTGETRIAPGLEARLDGHRTTRYGMPEWRQWSVLNGDDVWMQVDLGDRVELGPFYLRHLCTTRGADGRERPGMAEVIRPDRIDLSHHRPLVRMRVGRPTGDSMWRPLFTGPREGRVSRLVRSWAGA